jgi:microcystin-dependent protein
MAEPFLAEIRMMAFNYAPVSQGWALCNGQLLPINQNQALFSLLGTTFGGNGQITFALPDLRGQTPIHVGQGFTLGQKGGEQTHTLSTSEMPTHTHVFNASQANATVPIPTSNFFAASNNMYAAATNLTSINPATITNTGGSQAHQNMQPYLTITFAIALQGIFPSAN